MITTTSA